MKKRMTKKICERGSEWNRWDLHMHTPETKKNDQFNGKNIDEKWENFIKTINNYPEDVKVVGITDYFCTKNYEKFKKYFEEGKITKDIKLILPNIELRLDISTVKNININLHCIFNPDIYSDLETDFFNQSFHNNLNNDREIQLNEKSLIYFGKSLEEKELNKTKEIEDNRKYNDKYYLKKAYEKLEVDIDSLKEIFKKNIKLRENTIIIASNKTGDGISGLRFDKEDIIAKAKQRTLYNFCDGIFSSNLSERNYFLGEKKKEDGTLVALPEEIKEKYGSLKPCFHGSDAHSNDRIFNPVQERYCWVKAKPTFAGLKQAIQEPKYRIFIGEKPEILKVSGRKYIDKLYITKEGGNDNDVFFNNVEIYFNRELVTIIGNKGMGKSAIADIIGLCGNSKNYKYFSFLNEKKFLKNDGNIAQNFKAKLSFISPDDTIEKRLNAEVENNSEERVKYIPQGYFENLCSDINNEEFQKELESIIFSYTAKEVKEDFKSRVLYGLEENKENIIQFPELINKLIEQEENELHGDLLIKLNKVNSSIVTLQKKKTNKYINFLEFKILNRIKDIESHLENRPMLDLSDASQNKKEKSIDSSICKIKEELKSILDYPKIKEEEKSIDSSICKIKEELKSILDYPKIKEEEKSIDSDLDNARTQRKKIENIVTSYKEKLNSLTCQLNSFYRIKDDLEKEKCRIEEYKKGLETKLKKNGIKIEISEIFSDIIINIEPVDKIIKNLEKEKEKYTKELDENEKKEKEVNNNIKNLIKNKNDKFEKFLEKIKEWKEKFLSLMEKKDGEYHSLIDILKEKKYIENDLNEDIKKLKDRRKEITKKIYSKRSLIIEEYKKLKANLDEELKEKLNDDDLQVKDLDIDISIKPYFILDSFKKNFLEFINKSKKGTFKGKEEGKEKLNSIIKNKNLMNFDDLYLVLEEIISNLENPEEKDGNINYDDLFAQLLKEDDLLKLYDYLFSLKYLKAIYKLQFNNKNLDQLSPGERGIVMLTLHLLLDKKDIPLIIDQPEDNLDNQSIYKTLVPLIRHAKKRRQLIIVTHNPNIAVAADSEQVIHVTIDKNENSKFSFKAGGIEDPDINKSIVDILEGTKPAFDERKSKYLKSAPQSVS